MLSQCIDLSSIKSSNVFMSLAVAGFIGMGGSDFQFISLKLKSPEMIICECDFLFRWYNAETDCARKSRRVEGADGGL